MEDFYKTIDDNSQGFFKDKGSKFFAFAFPVSNKNEIKIILAQLKKEHHSARHHCFAWRLGIEEIQFRANDDGEPSSSAGKPILGQLLRFDVTNVLIVVIRYFGGTLLGVSGLINAYRNAAASALNNSKIITKPILNEYELVFDYTKINDVMQIMKQENLNILDTQFKENCRLKFAVRKSLSNRIYEKFTLLFGVEITRLN